MRRSLAVLLLVLAACSSPSGPVAVPDEDIPFPIARAPESPGPGGARARFDVFFIRRGRLVAVARALPLASPRAEAVMRALLGGPVGHERERGITTAIPAETRFLEVGIVDTIAEVDLSSEFQDPAPSDMILLRVAQVVFTLVALPNVTAVRFVIDGEPVSVVTGRGTTVERPVTAPDYAALAPRPP